MNPPKVSVVMPVFNGEKYLREAIESILNQTFTDFEFLILNDGSTDLSVEIVESYDDERIRLVHSEKNQGLVPTRNKAIGLARGEYIAVLDCDDVSSPQRLEKQVAFMDAHPDVGVCGAWIQTIGEIAGNIWDFPTDDATIRSRLLFESVLPHSSVMMRKRVLDEHKLRYNPLYNHTAAEDYELWVRCSKHTKLANIPEVLTYYRLHESNISKLLRDKQKALANKVRCSQLSLIDIAATQQDMELHESISTWMFRADEDYVNQASCWLQKLGTYNEKKRYFSEPAFSKVLAERWLAVCNHASALGLWAWRKFWSSPLSQHVNFGWKKRLEFLIKFVRH